MKTIKNISNIFFNRNRIIYSLFLSVILSGLIVIGEMIEEKGIILFNWPYLFLFFVNLIVYFIICISLFYIIDVCCIKKRNINIKDDTLFFISFAFLSLVYIFFLLGVYPGFYAYDTEEQYVSYLLNNVTDHHPVLHTLFFGYIIDYYSYNEDINLGGFAYSVLQILFLSAGFSTLSLYVYKKTKNIILWVISNIFYLIYVPIVLQALTATKDGIFLAFYIITIVFTILLIDYSDKFYENKAYLVLWLLSFVFMILMRKNCLYAVPFLIICVLLTIKNHVKKTLACLLIIILFAISYNAIIVPLLVYEKIDDREKMSVPIQQLDRIYNSSNTNLTEDEKIMIEDLLGEGVDYYNPRISDMPKSMINMDYYYNNKKEVISKYIHIVLNYPKISTESFLENTLGFWYPYSTLALYYDGEIGYWETECWSPWYFEPKIPFIKDFLCIFGKTDFILYNPIAKILFYPGSLFFLFIIMFGYSLYKKEKGLNVVFFYTLMLYFTYFLGPVALVRYAIYLYAIVPLYLTLFKNKK